MAGQKRTRTKYTGIYFNENTKKYDVKYNFTQYDAVKQENVYKSKWKYNCGNITEARQALAKMQNAGVEEKPKDITLQGAFELWKANLIGVKNGSEVTVRNTEQHLRMISQFLPLDTKVKDITEDVYVEFCSKVKNHNYSEETCYSLNACLKKLLSLCYRKRLIKENIFLYVDNMRTEKKDDYKLISKSDFDKLDTYFATHSFKRLNVDNYPLYRLIVNILFYTGIRCGELLALTKADFDFEHKRIHITKAYVSDLRLVKCPKNFKKRSIPVSDYLLQMSKPILQDLKDDERLVNVGHGAVSSMIKTACNKCEIEEYNCHCFRHTFISNLIRNNVPLPVVEKVSGDSQQTIFKRYSHMFASDDEMIIDVLMSL